MTWFDNFNPLIGVLVLSGLLCAWFHVRILFACEPKTPTEAYDFKTLYAVRITTFIVFIASLISLNLPQIPPDIFFLVWLNYSLLTTFLILWNSGQRMFNILLCFLELSTCILNLILFLMYNEGAYQPDPHGYLYMDINFYLNVLQMLLLMIGGFIVQKSNRVRNADRFSDRGYSFGHNFSYLHDLGRSAFIRHKIEKRSEEVRSKKGGITG